MTKEEIIKKLRDMSKYPTVTLPRDTEALRNAADLLEQAEQAQPVAVWELFEDGWDSIADPAWMETLPVGTKLYTAPPLRQPLTDEQIGAMYNTHLRNGGPIQRFARAIEAKLKEKNT